MTAEANKIKNRNREKPSDAVTVDPDVAFAHPHQADHHADGRSLPRPVRAQEAEHFSPMYVQAEPVNQLLAANELGYLF